MLSEVLFYEISDDSFKKLVKVVEYSGENGDVEDLSGKMSPQMFTNWFE